MVPVAGCGDGGENSGRGEFEFFVCSFGFAVAPTADGGSTVKTDQDS